MEWKGRDFERGREWRARVVAESEGAEQESGTPDWVEPLPHRTWREPRPLSSIHPTQRRGGGGGGEENDRGIRI